MGVVGDFLADEIDKETRKTALGILRDVILQTPVDTGRARGNWQASTSDINSTLETTDKSGSATITAQSANITIGADTYYIINNLPYIKRLNDGYSKQAPAKFVETAIKRNTK